MEAKIKRQASHCQRGMLLLIAAGSTEYLLVDISLSGMLSVVMVNEYSDFKYKYFCLKNVVY